MRLCQHQSAYATTSVSTYTKLNTPPRLWSLNMVQLSTDVQLIKAVCTSEKKRDGFSHKKIVLLCDTIRKGYRGNTHRNHSGDHNKGIACRYVVASNRAQVVSTYTCATTTQAIFPYPLSPAPIVIIERVRHLSHCIEHLCPDTQPSLDSLVLPGVLHYLVRFGDCLHCSSWLPILVLSILSVTICRSLCSI